MLLLPHSFYTFRTQHAAGIVPRQPKAKIQADPTIKDPTMPRTNPEPNQRSSKNNAEPAPAELKCLPLEYHIFSCSFSQYARAHGAEKATVDKATKLADDANA
mmetsp:Transcript_12154/g.14404  ORF Transcript_12154/g.14404 Transcript_12154/m.14404 type:complete len:103 (+) Transcript_12154:169-477(+)